MRDRSQSRRLLALAEIRELQRLRAESSAQAASTALAARKDALSKAEEMKMDALRSWTDAATASDFLPEIAALWSRELLSREETVRNAASESDRARQELERRTVALNTATLHRDDVAERARRARKEETRKEDDAGSQDVLDLHLARRRNG